MNKKRPSLDGFVSRSAPTALGGAHQQHSRGTRPALHTGDTKGRRTMLGDTLNETSVGRAPIKQSLQDLDTDTTEVLTKGKKLSRRERRANRREKRQQRSKIHRIIRRVVVGIIILVVAVAGFLAVKAFITAESVFEGGFFGLTQRQPLKQDANGRSNILIFGTSQDSEDHNADGGSGPLLTDSVMVLSVNQESKDAFMVSMPRDLWVKYDAPCSVGWEGKINSVYQCASDFGKDPAAGAAALQKKVGEVTGLDIQYYAQIDYSVVTQSIDAVGGVEVTIESNPKGVGILDRNFDWRCNYTCHYVKYADGQTVTLDGEHALALARARNASGGYGLAAGNFDREKNQQKILKALREKALSVGTLTNLGKVTGLMDALKDHLKTSVSTSEIQTIMTLASEIESDKIRQLSLIDEDNPLVKTGAIGTSSAVMPVAGQFNYSAIKAFIAKHSVNGAVASEAAPIVVLNGTSTAGLARTETEALMAKGYNVTRYDNAPEGTYEAVEIYQIGEGNSATADALKKQYNITTIKTSQPPIAVEDSVRFVVVIGQVRNQ